MRSTIVMTGASRGIGRVAAARIVGESPDTHLLLVARGDTGARLSAELGVDGRAVSHVSADTHVGDFMHNLGMVPGPAWRYPEVLARSGAFSRPATAAAAGRTAYSTSKLAVIHLVHEYVRRLPAGIDVVAHNPGFVPGTGLARNAGVVARFAMRRILPALVSTPFATSMAAAGRGLAEAVVGTRKAPSGSYVDRDRVARSSEESYDPQRESELWEVVERLTAPYAR